MPQSGDGERQCDSDVENIRRIDSDAPQSVDNFHGFQDSDKASPRPLATDPGFGYKFDEGPRAAVQYWQFQVVNLHHGVVHIQSSKGRKKMLGRRDQDAFLHQTGGVANSGYILGLGFDGESLEVGATVHYTRVDRGGAKTQIDFDARVEANAGDGDRGGKGVLVSQNTPQGFVISIFLAI